ncbi:hypothetical protein, partial [Cutibacterium avidum]|uniref:hypothetical protein n=1 Tax=Cutibacterium avidum TaxID=33010 RepID=UPI00254BFFB5
CIKKSLTIKDTLLSSQASHPPEQPHRLTSRATPRRPDQPYHTNPNPAKPAESESASKTSQNRATTPKSSDPINLTRSTSTHQNHRAEIQFGCYLGAASSSP